MPSLRESARVLREMLDAVLDLSQAEAGAVQARPELQSRWRDWWQLFRHTVDMSVLLADLGFAPRSAFISEFGHRLRRKLLPATPETRDMAELFELLLPEASDADWLRALDPETLQRIGQLLFAEPAPAAGVPWGVGELLDALTFSVSQVSATGFASEIRVRMAEAAKLERPFHHLPHHYEAFRAAVVGQGARSAAALAASATLREQLDACRHAAYTVYAHLDEHGISVGIVFRLRQLRERVLRIKALLDCLQSEQPLAAMVALLARLVQVSQEGRSLRALVTTSTHLTAAKVAERSAESGEHYITRNATEYRRMLAKAAGGGAVIGLTTWAKFALYALGLSAFWGGLVAGLNYAASFVLIMLLHWTVATKQPAVTAPAMAARLRDLGPGDSVEGFVDEVTHLLRSQTAAIAGNLGAVVPVVLGLSLLLSQFGGGPMVGPEQARHVLDDLRITGPTALFVAFTGVLLFTASIIAGWVENWFVLHRLDSALAHNPRVTGLLGPARAARWARFMRANVSGLAANTSLGLLLGLVPAFAAFFGLGLEVRHVTLSAGQLSAAVSSLGPALLATPEFWLALAGVLAVGPLNLGVSFYCAFRLALAAQNIPLTERRRIRAALWQRLRRHPRQFLLPPRAGTTLPPRPATDTETA